MSAIEKKVEALNDLTFGEIQTLHEVKVVFHGIIGEWGKRGN